MRHVALILALAGALPARADGSVFGRPFRVLREQAEHNRQAIHPAERLGLREYRAYRRTGQLPERTRPSAILDGLAKESQISAGAFRRIRTAAGRFERASGGMANVIAITRYQAGLTAFHALLEMVQYANRRGLPYDVEQVQNHMRDLARDFRGVLAYEVQYSAFPAARSHHEALKEALRIAAETLETLAGSPAAVRRFKRKP